MKTKMATLTVADRRVQGVCSRTRVTDINISENVSDLKAKITQMKQTGDQNFGIVYWLKILVCFILPVSAQTGQRQVGS